jgi:DNA replication protein DnaC
MQTIKNQLRDFKLSGIYNSIEERIAFANDKSLSYMDFIGLLLEDETNNRRDNSYKKRYAKARFPSYKKIEDFDFSFQPSIDKRIINDAITC